jgi:gliding motility-associated-like protein
MKNLRIKNLFILCLLAASTAFAQDELWYFGGNMFTLGGGNGLSFTGVGNAPVLNTTSAKFFYEAVSVVGDGSGNVRFYTDGLEVFNKNNVKMPALVSYAGGLNGAGKLSGSYENGTNTGSSPTGCWVINEPGSTDRFYIFTVGETNSGGVRGFRYTIVDMTLNGGLGDLVVGSIDKLVVDPGNELMTEGMAAYGSPCGDTTWVVVHSLNGTNFYAYPVTAAGIGSRVVSSIAPNVVNQVGVSRGSMDFSPDGSKLGFCLNGGVGAHIYDFNASTGVISNHIAVEGVGWYGCEWSPDGNIFYYSSSQGLLKRYIVASSTIETIDPGIKFWGDLERGKDGKLYIGKHHIGQTSTDLATIDDPNNLTLGSIGFNINGFAASGGINVSSGLPQMFFNMGGSGGSVATITNPVNDTTVCDNISPFQLAASPITGVWSSVPSGFVNSSGLFDPGAGLGTGPWNVKIYYGNPPCLANDSVTITVNVCCPPVSTSAINDTCAGASINLTNHVVQGAGNWSIVSGTGGSIVGSTFTSNTAGSFTVRYTLSPDPGGSCTKYSEQTFDVIALPVVNVADHSICQGDPAWVFDAGAGFTSYNWTGPVTGSSQTLSTSTQGTYTITVTQNGCSNSDQAVLTVNNKPTVTLSFTDSDVCINESSFALSGGSPSGGTYSGTGVLGGNFDPSVALVGAHTIKYKFTNGSGCSDSATAVLTVRALPLIDMDIPVNTICIDAPSFVLSGGNPTGGVYSGRGVNAGSFDPATAGAGNDTITYTVTNNFGCVASATDTIHVHPLPAVTFTLAQPSACIDATAFNLSGGAPLGGTYSGNGVGVSPLFDPANAGGAGPKTITYTYTNPLTTCTNSATATLTVNALPSVSLSDTSTCPGGAGVTLIPSPSSWAAYEWNDASTNPTLTVNVPNQIYWVRVTDNNGCKDSASAFVAMGDTLHVDFGGAKEICSNENVVLNAAQFGPFAPTVTYTWFPSAPNQSTLTVNSSGLYGVLVMDGRGCVGGDTVNITVHDLPTVQIPDSAVCFTGKESIPLSLLGTYKTIDWSTGSVSKNTTIYKPSVVTVTVTNIYNCAASDTANYTDYCEPTKLCFPNVVTPNGDGNNDEFIPCKDDKILINDGNYKSIVNNILHIDLQVYDRWGVCVFHSLNTLPRWDCTYQGNRVASAVYYYVVRYTDSAHNNYEQTGWVQVLAE